MKTSADYTIGQAVTVHPAYRSGGGYQADGDTGQRYVVGRAGALDLKLARQAGAPWEVIVHLSRIDGSGLDHFRTERVR